MLFRLMVIIMWLFVVLFLLNNLPRYDHQILITMYVAFSILYLLQTIPPFGFMWKSVKWFFTILLIYFSAGYIKKEIKDWWNKD